MLTFTILQHSARDRSGSLARYVPHAPDDGEMADSCTGPYLPAAQKHAQPIPVRLRISAPAAERAFGPPEGMGLYRNLPFRHHRARVARTVQGTQSDHALNAEGL